MKKSDGMDEAIALSRPGLRWSAYFAQLFLAVLLFSSVGFAQTEGAPVIIPAEEDTALLSSDPVAEGAQTFLDQVLAAEVEEREIVGAAAVLLKDGEMIAASGAGFADAAANIAVDPEATRFRLGSISKLITATAVMQLVDRGDLDLDTDINAYVDFDIPGGFGEEITLRHLLTHTAGYSDVYSLIFLPDDTYHLPLEDYVKTYQPPVVYAPGSTLAYSNYSMALAGYIVQNVSGQSYEKYVQDQIFRPLGMASATMMQPLPEGDPALSVGYMRGNQPGPFEYIGAEPYGALTSTLTDFAKFYAALQRGGEFEGARILSAERVAEMLTLQDMDPATEKTGSGFGIGFAMETSGPAGREAFHGGDTVQFHSNATLWLDQGYALIISQNTDGWRIAGAIERAFEDYAGFPKSAPGTEVPDAAEAKSVAGTYFNPRYSSHSILKIAQLAQGRSIAVHPDGGLQSGRSRFARIAPFTYQDVERADRLLIFLTDESGKVIQVKDSTYSVGLPVPFLESQAVQFPLIGFAVTGMLVALVCGLVALITRLFRQDRPWPKRWLVSGLMGTGFLVCLGGFAATILGIQNDVMSMTPERNTAIRLFQLFGWVFIAALVGLSWLSYRDWMARQIGWLSSAATSVFLLSGLAGVWFLATWNVLTFNLRY